ncbi:hypothetical protein GE09DRAFT_1076138 [Coniochaeta sp. 2T2.1]|nr:hypothetical protein GE09DRAFT_1076138 [Coniochaeta sp. 2T2.1]
MAESFPHRPPPPGPRASLNSTVSFDIPTQSPATNVQPQPRPSVLDEEPIPRMKTIAPCIFVPLATDITKPRAQPPRSRVDKLERMVVALQAHRHGVIENITYMAERERLAILQWGRQREAVEGPGPGTTLPPEEEDWIMGNMAAPAPRNREVFLRDEEGLQHLLNAIVPGRPSMEERTAREEAASHLASTARNAVTTVDGYNKEVNKRVEEYSALLQREKARLDDAGKRPEERRGSG